MSNNEAAESRMGSVNSSMSEGGLNSTEGGSSTALRLARTLMIQGTASDVGKSIVTAALCRIFVQDGKRVAPFKSQNMSLNSYVTPDGREIGRAQGVQADACRIAATTDMNPILLKPTGDMRSQVVVHGKPLMDMDAGEYRESYLPVAEGIVRGALDRLRQSSELVILEGAGSPAEINLKDRDIVNMRMAGWADAPVVLVADIDRGGVFAAIVGTLELLEPDERDRVKGFIINKFRGDIGLLRPGLDWLERRTGKPVLGVIPYYPKLGIEDEDSASLDSKKRLETQTLHSSSRDRTDVLEIGILRLPRISNFTDIDPLHEEPDVHVRYITGPDDWGSPDILIIPGSKNTIGDLLFLRESGLAARIGTYARKNGYIAGICGGYQILGESLSDCSGAESGFTGELEGLGLLPVRTEFTAVKKTVRAEGICRLFASNCGLPVEGYEIHMGETHVTKADVERPFRLRVCVQSPGGTRQAAAEYHPDGASADGGRIWGTYLHGVLHNDDFRRAWLNEVRLGKGWEPLQAELRYREKREEAFDRLAVHVRAHLDMAKLYEIAGLSD
ncbi:cobyric acid synthase [Paenibacillus lutrae]|uniref:Cobyric acid synthase n=1 Tax=Paenibacillus lutrae TaxID=2078573 RepID=A0A7X3FFV2_9BACL|nr:cobyric acid synthase [Paenibacillus lutrae]MVO98963.1 cobyric acid synthase [Paenibacillus lutrae]